MKTFITSDLHFGHKRIVEYCPATRGHFTSMDQMHESMIAEWNKQVTIDDTVYILGDVSFLPVHQTADILHRLNGTKILIEGNHDKRLMDEYKFRECFSAIHKYLEVTYKSIKLVMFHFPIYDHNGASRGSIMLHGHRHGEPTNLPGKIMDVGFDSTGQIVIDMDTVLDRMKDVPVLVHHAREQTQIQTNK